MKLYSKPIAEHPEVPVADDGRFEELVNYWDNQERGLTKYNSEPNKCYVVSLGAGKEFHRQQAEILSLVRTQGDRIVGQESVRLLKTNPRTLLGSGKAKEIALRVAACGANLLVLDAELSPSQMRNLEDTIGIAVCDREAVILNVFKKHARTKRAQVQVEVAHLNYLRPRIRGLGLDMEQQAAGFFTGRGPGETASAMLARKLDGRLLELRKTLATIEKSSATQRARRRTCKQVTLVGYTNAGKTSLMNGLVGSNLSAKDKPFETLDMTTRCLSCHGGDVLLSDTVGFIRRLPDRLLASFESTLEGIKEASLLVVVVDISDSEKMLHIDTTLDLLKKLDADTIPRLFVFNKVDLLEKKLPVKKLTALSHGCRYISLSSLDRKAVKKLRTAILAEVRSDQRQVQLFVPYAAGDLFSIIYAQCRVIRTEAARSGLLFVLEGERQVVAQIKDRLNEVYHA